MQQVTMSSIKHSSSKHIKRVKQSAYAVHAKRKESQSKGTM